MSSAVIEDYFSPALRSRGNHYFRAGRVTLISCDGFQIQASVRGTATYAVELDFDGSVFCGGCSCPFSGGMDPCKHLWAVYQQAISDGVITGDGAQAQLREFSRPLKPVAAKQRAKPVPAWARALNGIESSLRQSNSGRYEDASRFTWPENTRILYIVNADRTFKSTRLSIDVGTQSMKRNGEWGAIKRITVNDNAWRAHPDLAHRTIAQQLSGWSATQYYGSKSGWPSTHEIEPSGFVTTVRLMCGTGCCHYRTEPTGPLSPLAWDEGPAWQLRVSVAKDANATGRFSFSGAFHRGEERINLNECWLTISSGLFLANGKLSSMEKCECDELLEHLKRSGPLLLRRGEIDAFLQALFMLPGVPPIDLPAEAAINKVQGSPKPQLKLRASSQYRCGYADKLAGNVSFAYGTQVVPSTETRGAFFDAKSRQLLDRDRSAERKHLQRLFELGFRQEYGSQDYRVASSRLSEVVTRLSKDGWHVEAEGKLYRTAGEIKVEVNSGIDWFDLNATVDFGDQRASLPQLLEALERGQNTVVLGDGTVGMLPEQWLKKHAMLAGLGKVDGDAIRFKPTQVGVLDALLCSMPEANCDAVFSAARDRLKSFAGVAPADPPAGFVGELRPYQREGLGWLHFLRDFSFGGCLADDMGLGKTIQVLGLLQARHKESAGASLVVVPRSLVFNWQQEAARFAPELRVLDHTGMQRSKECEQFQNYDIVLTTYGTLRRDAAQFRDFVFDYLILDEAQAIKNATTESAKAARVLQGKHRLAMSGTPVENHLGELWSIFEFLNPGMLGSARVFKSLTATPADGAAGDRSLLASALRPFILRRTKKQVAADLPEKLEQTLHCELEADQRKLYDDLRDYYRKALHDRIEKEGINKAKIVVLEALLRLRQAACHPGLIDKNRTNESSAKLETLMAQLTEVLQEGHKVLVFSQFTSMLAIVQDRVKQQGIVYEYLDGKTKDRQARVERFQTDPACKLFLISLKAGGVGLNLTAADYVFLLDPWWNPAVEAQAIDRTHRIGQTRSVFAYRLIAKDTVEEKVLELQQRKRQLADAIIGEDNSLISQLTAEDLNLLLS